LSNPVIDISSDMTVNEIVNKYPRSLPVFKAFGIDTCCGGAHPLGVVIARHHLQDAQIVEALRDVLARD
jgi:iron-sulfur cluster repair protein YtfE (RIC family)